MLKHRDFKKLANDFQTANPFPHIVIDDFFKSETADELYKVFPNYGDDFWYVYNNAIEKKHAYNKLENMPKAISKALTYLNSKEFIDLLHDMTQFEDLQADPGLHGGGMHCIPPGGKLDIHLDYNIHPNLNLQRRLNLIVYLNKTWKEEYGGYLELWDKDMKECVKRVLPKFNRAVIFNTSDISYHGHPDPIQCPEGDSRKSLALYYLTEPEENATQRYRAKFVKRPSDPDDPEVEKLRKLRSDNKTAKNVYRDK